MKKILLTWTALVSAGVCISVFMGCVSLPKDSVQTSERMGIMVGQARKARFDLIDDFEAEKIKYIDYRLYEVWFPEKIGNLLDRLDIREKVCNDNKEMRDFAFAASNRYTRERKELVTVVEKKARKMRKDARTFFDKFQSLANAQTANLKIVQRDVDFQNKIMADVGAKEFSETIQKAGDEIDKLIDIKTSKPFNYKGEK